jgi:hypothetical protein
MVDKQLDPREHAGPRRRKRRYRKAVDRRVIVLLGAMAVSALVLIGMGLGGEFSGSGAVTASLRDWLGLDNPDLPGRSSPNSFAEISAGESDSRWEPNAFVNSLILVDGNGVPLLGFLDGNGRPDLAENGKLGEGSKLADCMAAEGAELLSCAFLFGNANAAVLANISPTAGPGIFGPATLFGPQQGFAFTPDEGVAGSRGGTGGQGAGNPLVSQVASQPGDPVGPGPFEAPLSLSPPLAGLPTTNLQQPPPGPGNNPPGNNPPGPPGNPPTPVSEPWSVALLGGSIVALALFRRRHVLRMA